MKLIINPYEKYSENTLLTIGLFFTFFGIYCGWFFNAKYDGIIDMHFCKLLSFYETIFYVFMDIILLSILLFVSGKIINIKTRIVDVLVAILIARIPLYLITISNVNNAMFDFATSIQSKMLSGQIKSISLFDLSILIFTSIMTFAMLIWSIILLYNGFKNATNLKTKVHILQFVSAIIIAEIISKTIISKFL